MTVFDYWHTHGDSNKIRKEVFGWTATEGPTVGVAINADPTAYATTEAMMVIDNTADRTASSNNTQIIVPVSIQLWCTASGTAGTFAAVRFVLDTATTFSSGGTTLGAKSFYYDTTASYSDITPVGQIHFGDVTLSTSGTSRKTVWEGLIASKATAFAVGDVHNFNFGVLSNESLKVVDYTATSHVARGDVRTHAIPAPVQIGPGCSLIMQPFFTDMSAACSFGESVVTLELKHPRQTAS